MAFLKKRGRYYYVRYNFYDNGRVWTITKSLGTRYKDVAQKMLRELERKEQLGEIDPSSPGFDPTRVLKLAMNVKARTVKDAVKLFLKSKRHLSPKTLSAYTWPLEELMNDYDLQKAPPETLTIEHFEAIIFKAGIKSATRHYYYRHFRTFWNFLLEENIVKTDFFDKIKAKLPPQKDNTRRKMITEPELMKVFATFDNERGRKIAARADETSIQHWFKPILALYFYAGLRRNEVAYHPKLDYSGLKGENLIYEDKELAYIHLYPTKGRTERYIPITYALKEHLQHYLKLRGRIKPNEYVFIYFGGKHKGKPVSGVTVYKEFKRYADLADISNDRTLHGMRHSAITKWIEAGFNTAEASYMAGHSSLRITQKYIHLSAKNLRDKMRRLGK